MNHRFLGAIAVSAACLLPACNRQQDTALTEVPSDASSAASVAATAPAAAAADAAPAAGKAIWFEPAAVSSCGAVKGIVHWDASAFPGVTTVKVALPADDGTEGVFAVSANVGQKETGDWMRGGMVVVLRDGSNDKELTRASVPSLPCDK